jgi:hypothetical protein
MDSVLRNYRKYALSQLISINDITQVLVVSFSVLFYVCLLVGSYSFYGLHLQVSMYSNLYNFQSKQVWWLRQEARPCFKLYLRTLCLYFPRLELSNAGFPNFPGLQSLHTVRLFRVTFMKRQLGPTPPHMRRMLLSNNPLPLFPNRKDL